MSKLILKIIYTKGCATFRTGIILDNEAFSKPIDKIIEDAKFLLEFIDYCDKFTIELWLDNDKVIECNNVVPINTNTKIAIWECIAYHNTIEDKLYKYYPFEFIGTKLECFTNAYNYIKTVYNR